MKEERASTDSSCKECCSEDRGGMEPWLKGNAEPREIFIKGVDIEACLDSMEREELMMLEKELDNHGSP